MRPSVPVPADLPQQVASALAEDIGTGDLTAALIPADRIGRAAVITREAAIVCGIPYVDAASRRVERARSGSNGTSMRATPAAAGQLLFTVEGPARALLTAERTALNFLQLLCATATAAHSYAALLEGTKCRLLDTRKTIPGLRTAQKYAVRVGGGTTTAWDCSTEFSSRKITSWRRGRSPRRWPQARRGGAKVPVEVEVENLAQLLQAIDAGADIAMLDNYSLPAMREAVAANARANKPLKLEASGGITAATIREVAETGVDFISVGSITKHVRAVDLSMRFEFQA